MYIEIMLQGLFRILHFDAPHYLGGWNGKSYIDICSHLTNLKSSYWSQKNDDCNGVVEEHFNKSYRVCVTSGILLVFFILLKDSYSFIKNILYHYINTKYAPRKTEQNDHHGQFS